MTENVVIKEFAKRERKLTVIFAVSFAIFGLTLLMNAFTEIYINPALPFLVSFALIFSAYTKSIGAPHVILHQEP